MRRRLCLSCDTSTRLFCILQIRRGFPCGTAAGFAVSGATAGRTLPLQVERDAAYCRTRHAETQRKLTLARQPPLNVVLAGEYLAPKYPEYFYVSFHDTSILPNYCAKKQTGQARTDKQCTRRAWRQFQSSQTPTALRRGRPKRLRQQRKKKNGSFHLTTPATASAA